METKTIAELNDELRQTLLGGRIVVTRGAIDALGPDRFEELMGKIRTYEGFIPKPQPS